MRKIDIFRFVTFIGNKDEVLAAGRRSADAAGQSVIFGDNYAVVVAEEHGVSAVYTTLGGLVDALSDARDADDAVRGYSLHDRVLAVGYGMTFIGIIAVYVAAIMGAVM